MAPEEPAGRRQACKVGSPPAPATCTEYRPQCRQPPAGGPPRSRTSRTPRASRCLWRTPRTWRHHGPGGTGRPAALRIIRHGHVESTRTWTRTPRPIGPNNPRQDGVMIMAPASSRTWRHHGPGGTGRPPAGLQSRIAARAVSRSGRPRPGRGRSHAARTAATPRAASCKVLTADIEGRTPYPFWGQRVPSCSVPDTGTCVPASGTTPRQSGERNHAARTAATPRGPTPPGPGAERRGQHPPPTHWRTERQRNHRAGRRGQRQPGKPAVAGVQAYTPAGQRSAPAPPPEHNRPPVVS